MKKYPYIVAAACVLVGAAGFAGMYATNQAEQQQQEFVQNEADTQQSLEQDMQIGYNTENSETNQVADGETDAEQLDTEDTTLVGQNDREPEQGISQNEEETDAAVGNVQDEVLHLNPDDGIMWPVKGEVLLDYSMDATILFPTLQQYKYNPSMVLSAKVNDKVYFVAKGKITSIVTNEETGCTVIQDIGDGYTAIYGQLKELNVKVGDMVESGQVVGFVSEPTKYYSVEGSNVYFQLQKDGTPVDPEEILPER